MKYSRIHWAALAVYAAIIFAVGACSSSSTNVVTVTVSPATDAVLAGQVATFTATVGGSTTTTSVFTCTFTTTTTNSSTGESTTSVAKPCPTDGSYGTWVQTQTQSPNVLTFTAPPLSKFPNPIPTLTFTATADANHGKTGTAIVGLDSGIRVAVTPTSATVAVGLTPPDTVSFTASFENTPALQQSWVLVQPDLSSKTTNNQTANPLAAVCSPTCGTIDSNGIYTPPSSIPTATVPAGSSSTNPDNLFAVVSSTQDPTRYSSALITLVSSSTNAPTFQNIFPTSIPAGSDEQNIYINAKNLPNTITNNIFFAPPGQTLGTPIATSNVYTIPVSAQYCTPVAASGSTAAVTCDASLMTRVQLTASQLALPGTATITIQNIPGAISPSAPCTGVTNGSGSTASTTVTCPLELTYASPAIVSAIPDSLPQPTNGVTSQTFGVDGGYFGAVSSPLVKLSFDGEATILQQPSARELTAARNGASLQTPGLYEVTVGSNAPQGSEPPFPTVTANVAIQPNFSAIGGFQSPLALPTSAVTGSNLAPSSIFVESPKGYAVLTEQAGNAIQLIDLTAAQPGMNVPPIPAGNQPTGIAIDDQITIPGYTGQDLAVVVSSGDEKLYLFAISRTGATQIASPIAVDLATLTHQTNTTAAPHSIGIDPGTHLAALAYANSNIGFIVDVNPNLDGLDTRTCFLSGQKPPCVIAPVSLVTGSYPQVVMQPQVPLAYVTPGGAGSTSVVDLLQLGTKATIAPAGANGGTSGAVRTAGITKIICTQATPHGINPALGGTVIISGLTPADLNGTFQVIPGSVTDAWTFSYSQPGTADETETNTGSALGTVQYGSPYYSFSTTSTASGAAINPITRNFGFVDYNATSSQIGFISTLDQNLSSLSLTVGSCYTCSPSPAGAPERGWQSAAFDPFVNVFMAFNPSANSGPGFPDNALSLINPGGTSVNNTGMNTNMAPYRIVAAIPTGQVGTGSYTPSGQSTPTTVNGPMGYDPKTKWVMVANAGSNNLSFINLATGSPYKKVQIQTIRVTTGGVPNSQPTLGSSPVKTCDPTDPNSPCMPQGVELRQAATVRISGEGFMANGPNPVVRLDGSSNGITVTKAADNEVDFSIAANTLTLAHDYALDVQSGSEISNSIDLYAVGILDMSSVCSPTPTSPQGPEAVAIDESRGVALVTNYSTACNSVSVIAINPNGVTKSDGSLVPYGSILTTVGVGPNPIGVAVIPRLGYAVVANSGNSPNGSATILKFGATPDQLSVVTWTTTSGSTTTTNNSVTVGLTPVGVAIDQDRALALVANNGSNTLSDIDLTVLLPGAVTTTVPTPITIALTGPPTAVAVDPNDSFAVVTDLQNSGTTSSAAGLDVIDLSISPPSRSTTSSISSLTSSLTGIVNDPAVASTMYTTSTQANSIYSFDPVTATTPQSIRVGINPYSIAYNPQTATILTINSTSNTSSIIDSLTFTTRQTLGISSQSQFAAAIDSVNNSAVIVDQNNNRVLFLGLPK